MFERRPNAAFAVTVYLHRAVYSFLHSSLGGVILAVMSQETFEPIAVRLLQSVCSFGDLLNHYPVGHSVPSCRSCTPTTTILTQFMQKTDNATILVLSPLHLCIRSLKEKATAHVARRCYCSWYLLLIFSGIPSRACANVSEQLQFFQHLNAVVVSLCSQITTFGHQGQAGCADRIHTAAGPKMTLDNVFTENSWQLTVV